MSLQEYNKPICDKRRNRRDRMRACIQEQKSQRGCKWCGETHPACLDFHHRDIKDKKFSISKAVIQYGMATIQLEIDKCDVLCANCHRKHHWKKLHPKRVEGQDES